MKPAIFAFLILALMIPLRADILVNGDFADGHAHWKGDAKDPDTADAASVDLSNQVSQGGVVITLKKDKWTKIYQLFSTRAKKLHYSITFTLGPDYKPDRDQPGAGSSPSPGLDDIENVYPYYGNAGGDWMLILAQTGMGTSSFSLTPDVRKAGSQTLSGVLRGAADEYDEMTLVFAFPPGEGSFTITKVTLTGDDK